MKRSLLLLSIITVLLVTGCGEEKENRKTENENSAKTEIANPAAVYCQEQGGKLNLETGICKLSDGTECEEWAFFRHECPTTASGAITPTTASGTTDGATIANPASTSCEKEGGKLILSSNPAGEYGICLFEDNRQCEEWALLRGECPRGGVKIAGYLTEAARYCAITGGAYSVTQEASNQDGSNEKGSCLLKNGQTCDAADYFAGTCR